jgi:UrcA family protein
MIPNRQCLRRRRIMKSATATPHALIALTALSSIMTAQPTAAATPDQSGIKSIVVYYSDLDLSSRKDAHRLYGRIKRAAHIACGAPPTNELTRLTQYESCLQQAITDAVTRVGSSQLSNILQTDIYHAP